MSTDSPSPETGGSLACLFNLVLFCHDSKRASYLEELIDMISDKFPCRVIFLQASLSSHSHEVNILSRKVSHPKRPFAYERVDIELGAENLSAHSLLFVLPYLVPDLPLYLMWDQDPTEDLPLLHAFKPYASRVIFDSTTIPSLGPFATRLLAEGSEASHCLVDITWARLKGWRNLLQQTFATPDRHHQLECLNHLDIVTNSLPDDATRRHDLQALYLQAWMATRLGWTPSGTQREGSRLVLLYDRGGQRIEVGMSASTDDTLPNGTLLSLNFSSREGHSFAFKRQSQSRLVRVEVSAPDRCEMPTALPLSSLEKGLQFLQELFYEPSSTHYQEFLGLLSRFPPTPPPFPWQQFRRFRDERRELLVPGNREETVEFAAEWLLALAEEAIEKRGLCTIALSGGSTPERIFERLTTHPRTFRVDWSRVMLFWSDERAVPPDHPDSNYGMAMRAGLSELPLLPQHVFRMEAEHSIERQALRYEELIQANVPDQTFDLILLGVGDDGHTASLFPHSKGLTVEGRLVLANYIEQKQTWRMTFTFEAIHRCRHLCVYVLGKDKAWVLSRILRNEDPSLPACRLGTKPHKAFFIADRQAAQLLLTTES